jgi:Fe-S cluster biogenesis protein NfuA
MENPENQAGDLRERVQAVMDRLRPALQMDGGDAELVDIKDGVVLLKLMGACAGCPMSTMTLKMGIEQRMKAEVPEIVAVEAI